MPTASGWYTSALAASPSPWYTSAIFWTIAGVVAVLLVGAVTIAVTWVIGVPKRSLVYSLPVVTSLLPRGTRFAENAFDELQVAYGGKPLKDPHIVSLRIESRSRRDIRSEDFDQGKPLVFRIGVPIVSLVGASRSRDFPADGFRISEESVEVGPVLVRTKTRLTVDLLTDGSPSVVCESSLADVTVKEINVNDTDAKFVERLISSIITAGAGPIFKI
jgi:hypothetical protein